MSNLFKSAKEIANTNIPSNVIAALLVGWISRFLGIPSEVILVVVVAIIFQNSSFNPFNLSKPIAIEQQEVKELKEERKKIIEKIENRNSVVDIIQLNLNQITEYYTINKSQARRSFGYSATLIFFGFIAIIIAVLLPFVQKEQKIELSVISGISGILLQFIGGANFVLYNKTLEQSNRFYNQLTRIQDTMLAIDLCKQVKDIEKSTQLMEKLIIKLIERSSKQDESEPVKKDDLDSKIAQRLFALIQKSKDKPE